VALRQTWHCTDLSKDNIKMDLRELCCEYAVRIHVDHDNVYWRDSVDTVLKHWTSQRFVGGGGGGS
jgi:hypothetical protein